MDNPIRKMLKKNDYNRHKLLRKIKRLRKAESEQEQHVAENELKKKLRRIDKKVKYDPGKDATENILDRMNSLIYKDANNNYTDAQNNPLDIIGYTENGNPMFKDSNGNIGTSWYPSEGAVVKGDAWRRQEAIDHTLRMLNLYNQHSEVGQDGTIYPGHGELEYVSPELDLMLFSPLYKLTLKNGMNYIFDFADRRFIPNRFILNQGPNTLTRYVGTGDSGYIDALQSGIIRGNPNPPKFSAADLAKMRRKFSDKMFEEDFRAMASNNITSEDQFNRINSILKGDSRTVVERSPGKINLNRKDYRLADSYLDYLNWIKLNIEQTKLTNRLNHTYRGTDPDLQWLKSWGDNSLPTFALEDEILKNNLLFPGDYAVQIRNSSKYAKNATSEGHFAEHPTTEYPMSYNDPDVSWYKRMDGLFTGRKYMVKIPKWKIARDAAKYNK